VLSGADGAKKAPPPRPPFLRREDPDKKTEKGRSNFVFFLVETFHHVSVRILSPGPERRYSERPSRKTLTDPSTG